MKANRPQGKKPRRLFRARCSSSTPPFIKDVIDRVGANSIFDYEAGKGLGYSQKDLQLSATLQVESIQSYWGVEDIRCYDPGYEPFSKLPSGQFDGVICTDVLEHITEPDVPWVLEEMFSYARNFVYANVACFPAVKFLFSGQNVHCTIHPPDWWAGVVHAVTMRHPEISYHLVMTTKTGPYKKFGFAKNRRSVHQTVERIV